MPPLPPARSRAGQHHVPLLNDSFHVNPGGPAFSAWQAPPMSFQPPPSVQPQLDETAAVAYKQQTKPACPQDCQAPGAIQYSRLKVGQGSLPKVPTWKGCLSSARDGAVWQRTSLRSLHPQLVQRGRRGMACSGLPASDVARDLSRDSVMTAEALGKICPAYRPHARRERHHHCMGGQLGPLQLLSSAPCGRRALPTFQPVVE